MGYDVLAMSIKRSKAKAHKGGRRSDGGDFFAFGSGTPEKEKTWEEHMSDQPEDAFVRYALTGHFAKGTLLAHSTFGKGIVLGDEGARIEVLFADGRKKLGHAPS